MAKIIEKDLINSLKQLKDIKPNQNWVIFCRKNLVTCFASRVPEKTIFSFDTFFEYFKTPVFKPIAVFSAIFLMIFGTSFTALLQAKNSLPGDHLYPIKISLEQARLWTATSDEGRALVQNEIFANRVEELNKVVESPASTKDRNQRIDQAVSGLQKYLLTINDEMPKIDSQIEAKKAVEMAKKIDANVIQVQQALNQAKSSLTTTNGGKLNEKITVAVDMADKASNDALEVMVLNQSEAGVMTQEEIAAKLTEKIQTTKKQIMSLSETVANSEIGNLLPINATIILDESDKAIEQAKSSIENNDMMAALQTIKAANELVKSAQKLVDNATPDDSEQDDQNNATSSSDEIQSATSSDWTLN